jgi:molybdate transport system ATP-binding protein
MTTATLTTPVQEASLELVRPPALEVDVDKSFEAFSLSLGFTVPESGITVLFGPSGAGKTTLLNLVAGLERPDRGLIRHHGRTLYDSSEGACLPPEKRRLGYVFQRPLLFSHLSVASNLMVAPRFASRKGRLPDYEAVVELLGLGRLLGRRPNTLSGGERQRVAIGRALMADPKLLLMDEPLSSLDQARKDELVEHIGRIPERFGITILYVTHDSAEAEALADSFLPIEGGRLRPPETPPPWRRRS